MKATTNAKNLRQYKIRSSLIAEQILAFASKHNMARKVKNLLPNSVTMRYVIEYFHLDS